MTAPDQVQVQARPDGKLQSNFFSAVRERGILNAMMRDPAMKFEKDNPGLLTKYVFAPTNGDTTWITANEAMGFRLVDWGEIEGTNSSKTSGPIRFGDAVLMCAPKELFLQVEAEDAQRAKDDIKLPETAYRDALESTKTRRSDGQEDQAKPIGTVRRAVETIVPKQQGGE